MITFDCHRYFLGRCKYCNQIPHAARRSRYNYAWCDKKQKRDNLFVTTDWKKVKCKKCKIAAKKSDR